MNNFLNIQGLGVLDIFCNMEEKGGQKNATEKAAWWQPALLMFLRLATWIAGPVIIALFIGKWLDKKYGTEPWLFLACTGLAFLVSMFGLIKNTIVEYKKIEKK